MIVQRQIAMGDIMAKMTVTLRVTKVKRTKLRLWLFARILRLAVIICPSNVVITYE